MKNKLTLITVLLIVNIGQTMSQSTGTQRLVLAEDFSSIWCPPSAPANIYFNALMNVNTSKVVKLTYQWHLLSTFDPMYQQNSQQLDSISYYYGLSSIPYARMDGTFLHPYNWTQGKIDSAYAIPSSFEITLTHSFNVAYDSIFISATITCVQDINLTTPKFRCAMTEESIHFASPPGNNGEMDFYNIMRRMYPDATGTLLSTSWTTGQTQTITFAEKIPSYIYDSSQIAVVAFIQDDLTKHVEQAAYSTPLFSTGINETINEINCSVYPNPATNHLTIALPENHKKVDLTITDITGKIIYTTIATGTQKIEINTKDYPQGIYLVQIQTSEFTKTKKLIIAK